MYADPRKNPGIKRPYIPLPAITAPAGEVCITIPVPDHPDHKRALLSVLQLLGTWHSWERTGTDEGAQAAAVWKEKLERIVWDGGDCVLAEADQCVDYMPSSSRIDYEPANPFTEPGTIPPGYVGEPFTIVKETDTGLLLLGFLVGDVMTDLTRYPGGATAPEIIASGLPRFILTYTAPAEIEFHFVQFPGGGRAVIRRDFDINPLTWMIVELNKDVASLPPETVTEIVIEFTDEDTGVHTYEVSFVPNVDESIPFIFFGGGLRKITICNEGGEEFMPYEIRQPEGAPCTIEASEDNGETWEQVVDLDLCPPRFRVRQDPEFPCNLDFSPFREGDETWFTFANLQLCPPKIRWRGGILEWFDGDGGEWIPFDTIDPIYTDPPPPVPRPEEEPNDRRCSAAASAAYAYVDLANRLYGLLNVTPTPFPTSVTADYAGIVSNTLNFFMGTDAFTNLVANAVFQVNVLSYITDLGFGMGGSAAELISVLDLTNPDTREKIKCALYCAMSDIGNVGAEDAFAAIDNAIELNGLASGWSRFIELFGAGGVNAAMSVGAFSVPASDCDCPECAEWCHELLVGESSPVWVTAAFGTLTDEELDATADGISADAWWWGHLQIDFPEATHLTKILMTTSGQATRDDGSAAWLIQCGEGEDLEDIVDLSGFGNPVDWSTGVVSGGDVDIVVNRLNFAVFARCNAWADGFARIDKIRLEGTGENPFGVDNCGDEFDLQDSFSDAQSPLVSGSGRDVTGTEFYIDDTGLHGGGQA